MFTVQIKTDNNAFRPESSAEIARILRELADIVDAGYPGPTISLKDTNGNTVAQAIFSPIN